MKKSLLMLAFFAVSLLIGCKNEMPKVEDTAGLVFDAEVLTKYSGGSSFAQGDVISVYAAKSGVELLVSGNQFDNSKYIRGEHYFVKEGSKDAFPASGGLDIYAFYPYNANGIGAAFPNYAIAIEPDQGDQTKMNKCDFLLAKQSVAPSLQPVLLKFAHMLSKFTVSAVTADDFKDGTQVASIKLKAKVGVSVNIKTAISIATGDVVDITPYAVADITDANKLIASAIVAPQSIAKDGILAEVTLTNGKKYEFSFADKAFALTQGKVSKIDLIITFGGDKPIVAGATITDWEDVNAGSDVVVVEQLRGGFTGTSTLTIMPNYTTADITVQGAGEMKTTTYNVAVISNTTAKTVYFEFRGANNVPTKYPYSIKRIVLHEGVNATALTVSGDGATAIADKSVKNFNFNGSAATF